MVRAAIIFAGLIIFAAIMFVVVDGPPMEAPVAAASTRTEVVPVAPVVPVVNHIAPQRPVTAPIIKGAKLVATVVAKNPKNSMAVFKGPTVYRLGERVKDRGRIVSIERRKVLVKRDGVTRSIAIGE